MLNNTIKIFNTNTNYKFHSKLFNKTIIQNPNVSNNKTMLEWKKEIKPDGYNDKV